MDDVIALLSFIVIDVRGRKAPLHVVRTVEDGKLISSGTHAWVIEHCRSLWLFYITGRGICHAMSRDSVGVKGRDREKS